MNYGLTTLVKLQADDCLVIGVFADDILPQWANTLDVQHQGLLTRLRSKLKSYKDSVWQSDICNDAGTYSSILLIQCGTREHYNPDSLKQLSTMIAASLLEQGIKSATICLPELLAQDVDWQVQQMLLAIDARRYQLLEFKTKEPKVYALASVLFFMPKACDQSIINAQSIAASIAYTRNLANLPANICTPSYIGAQAKLLADEHASLECNVMGRDCIAKLGMGALLAVAQGSAQEPQLVEIKYNGGGDASPIVLIGKGISFDSGGISLKPADFMYEMKYDMAGAASVLGAIMACALLKLPINVVGLLACAENMPSGTATRPGDIITTMSGQTVEITNTDAEGRLVLADALTYAERFKPNFVIDIATLTGAVIIALGGVNSGFMTSDHALAELINSAASQSLDKVWRLPLDDEYKEAIISPIADILNLTLERSAGSITAACFLSHFSTKYRWAHLDVAGTAWISGKKRDATGRPVPLLIQLLRNVADSR